MKCKKNNVISFISLTNQKHLLNLLDEFLQKEKKLKNKRPI